MSDLVHDATTPAPEALLPGLSREVQIVCDPGGKILWLDERAQAALDAEPGKTLAEIATAGSTEKVQRFLDQARASAVNGWEFTLRTRDKPATMTFSAHPCAGGFAMVGSFISQDYANVLQQMSATMGEVANLLRETERQKREIERRHEELLRLHRELAESDKGLAALHAEIEEKQDSLRHAGEVRSRVLTNVSHEFRTPLNSILGLARLLLDRTDGDLNPEQEKQVSFIRRSAEALTDLVNDLLDLSKIDAGKSNVRPVTFTCAEMFAAMRGMLRPMMSGNVALVFEEPAEALVLESDEGKIAQVMRNLISNAIKFTERGEVRISARDIGDGMIAFVVADTGIGIAKEDQARVFEEFIQIDSQIQRRVKGSGLGLSICLKLAELLGGRLSLQSEPGRGSTFTLEIPRVHPEAREMTEMTERSQILDPSRAPILVLEDDRQTLFLYEKYLEGSGFQVIPARSIDEAHRALERVTPAAIVLDIMLEGETSWAFLAGLKTNERTRDIPVLVVTITNREQKARALGADEFYVKPLDQTWLLKRLKALARTKPVEKILIIDDDEVARYVVRRMLQDTTYTVLEASTGMEGVAMARREQPQVIFLDFVLPGMTAFDVLDELKKDPHTRSIPVIVHTSKDLAEAERDRIVHEAAGLLPKQSISREVALGRIRDALTKAGLGHRLRNKEV